MCRKRIPDHQMIGRRYQFLTVEAYLGRTPAAHRLWAARCVCGNLVKRTTSNLRCSVSCGCITRKRKHQREMHPPVV